MVVGEQEKKNLFHFLLRLGPDLQIFLTLNNLVSKAGEIFNSRTIFKLKKVYWKQNNKILLIYIKKTGQNRGVFRQNLKNLPSLKLLPRSLNREWTDSLEGPPSWHCYALFLHTNLCLVDLLSNLLQLKPQYVYHDSKNFSTF